MAPNDTFMPQFCTNTNYLWVFGYGSLIWKPNFEYSAIKIGHIKGYVRRFWQGNTTHRGVPGKPGRVATLVPMAEGVTWGVAFLLEGKTQILEALHHLNTRECQLGGYTFTQTTFFARDDTQHQVRIFTATPECELYMGPASMDTIADQIVSSRGMSGHNLEYLFRLAETVRKLIPEDDDKHLFDLELRARQMLGRVKSRTPSQEMFMLPAECTQEQNKNDFSKHLEQITISS